MCPVGLCLPSNQCFPAVHNSSLTGAEEGKTSSGCAYVPFYNVHLSCASQASWARAVLVSDMCPSPACAKMPPSSSSPAEVLLPASHTSCVWPHFILFQHFGAFLPSVRTALDFPPPRCHLAWGMDGVWWDALGVSPALGQQGGTPDFFSTDIHCVYTPWAGLRNPAFICKFTSAKLRASSIYSFRMCVGEFLSLLGFPLLTEESILVIFFFFLILVFFEFSFSKISSRYNRPDITSDAMSRREKC